MRTTRYAAILVTLALVLAACGAEGETTTPDAGGGETDITLLAQNVAFDLTKLNVQAGEQITITFENRDAGIRHNLLINGPSGRIATDVEAGPVTQTLTFTIDEAGSYRFLCEVHPSVMVGELVVSG
jgi:plastocyanin